MEQNLKILTHKDYQGITNKDSKTQIIHLDIFLHLLNSVKSISYNDHMVLNYIDPYHTNFLIYFDEVNVRHAKYHLKTFQSDLNRYKDLTFDINCYLFQHFEDS